MSLDKRALCIAVKISQPQMKKLDRPTTNEVHELKHAEQGSMRVNKELFSRTIRMSVERPANTLRTFVNEHSHPWIERVSRIIPITLYDKIEPILASMKEDVEIAHAHFKSHYEENKRAGELALGDAYNEFDYPSQSEIDKAFNCELPVTPVPIQIPAHILTTLLDDTMKADKDELRKLIEQSEQDNLKIVTESCAQRVFESVQNIIEGIDRKRSAKITNAKSKKKTYRDSLVGNVWDLVQILPELNLADSSEIDDLHNALKQNLLGQLDLDSATNVTIKQELSREMKRMRSNIDLENSVKKEAESIMSMAQAILPDPE